MAPKPVVYLMLCWLKFITLRRKTPSDIPGRMTALDHLKLGVKLPWSFSPKKLIAASLWWVQSILFLFFMIMASSSSQCIWSFAITVKDISRTHHFALGKLLASWWYILGGGRWHQHWMYWSFDSFTLCLPFLRCCYLEVFSWYEPEIACCWLAGVLPFEWVVTLVWMCKGRGKENSFCYVPL